MLQFVRFIITLLLLDGEASPILCLLMSTLIRVAGFEVLVSVAIQTLIFTFLNYFKIYIFWDIMSCSSV
jgi:hypothetical protein